MLDEKLLQSLKKALQQKSEHPDSTLCPNCGAFMPTRIFRFYFADDAVDLRIPVCAHCTFDSSVSDPEIRFAA